MPIIPIVRVGNSRGLRISKKLGDAIGAPAQVQLEVQDGIIIRPHIAPRLGWDNPSKWLGASLTEEDELWLNAPLGGEA